MNLPLSERQRAMLADLGLGAYLPPVPRARPDAPELIATERLSTAGNGQKDPKTPRQAPVAAPVAARAALQPAAPAAPMADAGATTALRPAGIESMPWDALEQAVAGCRACKLCESRRNTVFGVGAPPAAPGQAPQVDWMIVGEAPGENEDLQGEPFVGQAGKLLDNMLRAIGLDRRANVYIVNVLKCRPPGNRNPEPAEVAQCEPFLRRQVELLRPKIILAMGRFAAQSIVGSAEPIGKLRGQVHNYHGVPVVVSYHPAYLLRNLPDKAKAWADLCLAQDTLDAASPPG